MKMYSIYWTRFH